MSSDSWQNLLRNSIRSTEELSLFLDTKLQITNYSVLIPKNFALKIKEAGPYSALWKQFVPSENENSLSGLQDPIGDHEHSPCSQIVHRYQNRVLFFPTQTCPIICRYCFRKNELGNQDELFSQKMDEAFNYIKNHPEVNEVIFSGGDPLILSDQRIEQYLSMLSEIEHIQMIRFHTRTPIILPERITPNLIGVLKKFQKRFKWLNLVLHINHPEELSSELIQRLEVLSENHISVLSQTVLLKGVNDTTETLLDLFNSLLFHKVRPYYLHHPDRVKGGMHFYLDLEAGQKIYKRLRYKLPGWGLPQYVIDSPQGKRIVDNLNNKA